MFFNKPIVLHWYTEAFYWEEQLRLIFVSFIQVSYWSNLQSLGRQSSVLLLDQIPLLEGINKGLIYIVYVGCHSIWCHFNIPNK